MTDIERRIREALRAYSSLTVEPRASAESYLSDEGGRLEQRSRRPRTKVKTILAVATTCVAVIIISAMYAYRNNLPRTGSGEGAAVSPAVSTPSLGTGGGGITSLVLRDGDRVAASGKVVALSGRHTRFCAPIATGTEINGGGIQYCDLGIDVTGVDLSSLTDRRAESGNVEGEARLTGIYRNGTIVVTSQGPPLRPPVNGELPMPPCSPPAGGWPQNAGSGNLDEHAVQAYERNHPHTVMDISLLHPSATQSVMYVLTSGDVVAVRTALREAYGDSLCVEPSEYTPDQVAAARALVSFNNPELVAAGLYGTAGSNLNANGQLQIEADLIRVTMTVAQSLADQPPGLIRLRPWLAPLTN